MMHIALLWDPYKHLDQNKSNFEEEKTKDLRDAIQEFRDYEGDGDG